jgi:nucleoside-diphosphate-sugar epimerase
MPAQKSSKKSSRKSKTTQTKTEQSKNKILVTGGLGLIGHNVVAQLQGAGHEVHVVDALTTYGSIDKDELEYLYNERLAKINKDTQIYKIDIADKAIEEIFYEFNPDYVIHLASFPREKAVKNNPVEAAHTMGQGLARVVDCAMRYKVKKLMYASSSMVYGDFEDGVKEDAQLNPKGAYAIWKIAGEQLVKDYHRQYGLPYAIVRPSAVYGPMDVGDRVIAKFLIAAMRGETLNVNGADEKLDFTYVDDAAAGIIAATLSKHTGTYNITKGHSCTLEEAANLAVKLAGSGTVNVNEKDSSFPSRGALNIDAAKADFGYDPKVNIEEGFQKYHEWLTNSVYWSPKTVPQSSE